jgi:aminomethyltransferase
MSDVTTLRRTSLYDVHSELGARFVPFAGWEMPVQYGSIIEESKAVRNGTGLFDVSHMGRLDLTGPGAVGLLNSTLSVNIDRLGIGRARYNVICDESGGIIDDCIVYRRGRERFLLVPNASNTVAVTEWLENWTLDESGVSMRNMTAGVAMIACQGPDAETTLQRLTDFDLSLSNLRPFRGRTVTICGSACYVGRTGYTGEDGFEIMAPSDDAPSLWQALAEMGAVSCGLAARDVLRLEAGLLLHGNDMDMSVNPYEAGIGRFVEPDREEYVAGEALRRIRDEGVSRKLVGFRMEGRGIARHGYRILDGGSALGEVSSGGPSPTLDLNIGMGYVPTAYWEPGTRIEIEIRGRPVEAQVTDLPFYAGGHVLVGAL